TITPAMYGANPTYTATVKVSNNHAKLACTVTEQVVITINPTPEIDAVDVTHVDCHGDNTGKISLTVTGGTGHTYAWAYSETSGGATTPLTAATNPLEDIVAGYYTVTVTNAEGCEVVSSEIAVNQPAEALTATVVPTSPLCSDGTGTIVVTATGGTPTYSYAWDPNTSDNIANVTGLATGTYTVTVSDARGCKFIGSADIVIPAQIVKDPSSTITDVACHGDSTGAINFVATGGTGALQYSINSGSTYQDNGLFTGLFSGNYTITVKDANNCVVNFTDQIVDQPDEALAATITQVNINCHGGATGEATVNATGGTTPYEYEWSTGATTAGITGLSAGTYGVTVTDDNDCTFETSVTITQLPEITLASSSIKHVECKGTSTGGITVVAQGGSGTFEYSINSGIYQNNGVFTLLATGSHVITVRDANDTTCTKDFNFVVEEPAVALTLNASVTDPIACHGDADATVTLIAADGWGKYTYTFNGVGSTTGIYTPIAAGTNYAYQVVDSLGCIITGTLDVDQPAELTVDATITTPVKCYGDSATVTLTVAGGTGPTYTYTLGTLTNNDGVFNVPAGNYAYSVKDENYCEVSSTVDLAVTQPNELTVTLDLTNPDCFGATGTIEANPEGGVGSYTYKWSDAAGQTTKTAIGLTSDTYTVTVTDGNDCTVEESATVVVPTEIAIDAVTLTHVLCYGKLTGKIELVATGGTPGTTNAYSYKLGSETNYTGYFEGLAAGDHTVIVTDGKGCPNSFDYTLNQPEELAVDPDIVPVKCNSGADGSIDLRTSGGVTPYTYAWSPNTTETTEVVTGLTAATYSVIVTDANGCELTRNDLVVDEPGPIVISFDPPSDTIICNGTTIPVTVSSTGGTGTTHTYEWSTDAVVAE
ncbi:MAG: SprB repeat-containing protein, partial [Bacteroidales bacterium]